MGKEEHGPQGGPFTTRSRIVPFVAAMRILRTGAAASCSGYPTGMDSMFQVPEILVEGLGENIKKNQWGGLSQSTLRTQGWGEKIGKE
jgi:hypothetical protein